MALGAFRVESKSRFARMLQTCPHMGKIAEGVSQLLPYRKRRNTKAPPNVDMAAASWENLKKARLASFPSGIDLLMDAAGIPARSSDHGRIEAHRSCGRQRTLLRRLRISSIAIKSNGAIVDFFLIRWCTTMHWIDLKDFRAEGGR